MKHSEADVQRWVERYNNGATLEEISLDEGVNYSTVSKRLRAHPDYQPRKAAPRPGTRPHRSNAESPKVTPIPKVVIGKAHLGHRRRAKGW